MSRVALSGEHYIAAGNATAPGIAEDREEILRGLTASQKRLSPKYFYDKHGSELFDRICSLPEYYPTRTELDLMEDHVVEIGALVGERAAVIELGAGSSIKVRRLLDGLRAPAAYVPVDISPEFLLDQVESLRADYPGVHMQPVFADFTQPFDLPELPVATRRNLVFFPGSTIGNFSRRRALELLEVMAAKAKPGGALLIGVDLQKDPAILHAAYNDAEGVTAEFNRNLLVRINRDLGADFQPSQFAHRASYREDLDRIEMHLVSRRDQVVQIPGADLEVRFAEGEPIHTENSHKYTVEALRGLAARSGFVEEACWTDRRALFRVQSWRVGPLPGFAP